MSKQPTITLTIALISLLALALGGCTKTPDQVVADLGDPQTLVRAKAEQSLMEMDRATAIPALLAAIDNTDARDGIQGVLIAYGEEVYDPTFARIGEVCRATEIDQVSVDSMLKVLEEIGTPQQILDSYMAASKDGGCAEKALLTLVNRIEPPKNDVTIDPGMNLRYKPVRFAYQGNPDLTDSRALARLGLYDPELGQKVADMNRDKDEAVYWAQWKMHDAIVRASLCRFLSEDIWYSYHDNFIPDTMKEEEKADPEDPMMLMADLASGYRDRTGYDRKAAEKITRLNASLQTYFASNDHFYDEPCLVYQAVEEMAKPSRAALDEKKKKKEMKALDEALTVLAATRELACNF
jgi:hypothetical protein